VIDVQLFTIMVLMALITTFTTSPVVACIYPPHHRKRFGSRPGIAASAGMEGMPELEGETATAAAAAEEEEEEEAKVAAPYLPLPPLGAEAEQGAAAPIAPCLAPLRLMLVAQRMTDVPGLALLMELIEPDRVSAVRFVESEEIPLSIIMSQGTLKTGWYGTGRESPCLDYLFIYFYFI
jgi:hypothetical protein